MKFPQSVLVWGAMSSAGVGPLCFIKTRVNAAVYQDILEHLEHHSQIGDTQHGFRPGRSCIINLIVFWSHVVEWMDVGYLVDVIFYSTVFLMIG